MGLFMLGGLIGGVLYSSHIIKKDIQAEKDDFLTKPTLDTEENKRKIQANFDTICRRSGITIDKYTKNPLDMSQCHKGIQYLQYQGYDIESVNSFEQTFLNKFNQQQEKNKLDIKKELTNLAIKHQTMLRQGKPYQLIVWRCNYYGDMESEERMQLMRKNGLWRTITKEDSTAIPSTNTSKYTEVWRIVIPKGLLKKNDIKKIYDKVCWVEDIDNGSFM